MGRHIDRAFIHFLVRQYYIDKRNHHRFCCCFNCKRLDSLLNEMGKWGFHNLNQFHDKWFILFFQFLFEKMSKYITVKYYTESEFAKEPYQATEDSAGYELFAAETTTFLPKLVDQFWLLDLISC